MAGNRCSPRRRSGVRTRALSQPAAPHEPHIRSTRPTPDSPPCDLTSSSDRPAVVPCTQPPKRDAQDARHVPCRPTTPGVFQHHSLRGDSSGASRCHGAAETWRRRRRPGRSVHDEGQEHHEGHEHCDGGLICQLLAPHCSVGAVVQSPGKTYRSGACNFNDPAITRRARRTTGRGAGRTRARAATHWRGSMN